MERGTGESLSSETTLASESIAYPQVLHSWHSMPVLCSWIPTQVFGYISKREVFFFKLGCFKEAITPEILALVAPLGSLQR